MKLKKIFTTLLVLGIILSLFSVGANAYSNRYIDVVTKDMTTGEIYTERVYPTDHPDPPSTPSSNSIIGDYDREPLDEPNNAICFIYSVFPDGSSMNGTGFVVGNNIILTAGHMIYDKSGETGYATQVTVYPGHSAGKGSPFGSFNATALHVTNNYAYESTGSDITRAYYDIGIIELGTNIESQTGKWELTYTGYDVYDTFINQNFSITGYNESGINSEQYYSSGSVTGVEILINDGIRYYIADHVIDTTHGTSGSPLHQGNTAFGVHVLGVIDTPVIPGETRATNTALILNKVYYDWIYDYVDGIL